MRTRQASRTAVVIAGAGVMAWLWASGVASAAPQELNCVLTGSGGDSATRPLVVVFDEAAKTLTANQAGQSYSFKSISITNVAISGGYDDVSLGIDRSSLGIVWQHYSPGKVVTEYGQCRPGAAAAGGENR